MPTITPAIKDYRATDGSSPSEFIFNFNRDINEYNATMALIITGGFVMFFLSNICFITIGFLHQVPTAY